MGLDASVLCDCFRSGLTTEPPVPRDWLHVDEEGYLNLKPEHDSDAAFHEVYEWMQTCCDHPDMRAKAILPALGGVCVGLGLVLIVATARLFGTVGRGTLAPWDPPQRLVVRGVYRHVRNPMMAGALLVLLGEAALSASLPLLCWFAVAGVVYAVSIPLSEEPGLVRRFGEDYLAYKRNVPRWVPRRKPWQPDDLPGGARRP